jgi:hypothetical protein
MQLARAETEIACQGDGRKPKLCRRSIPINVNMSRFTKIMTHKVYSVRPTA